MVQAPIFHVNGDDPEAVVFAAKVATEFRQKFHKDVVVDMFCYRRFGHNEGDDPTFTQPMMYSKIRALPSTREIYAKRLVEEGVSDQAEVDAEVTRFEALLDEQFEAGKTFKADKADWLDGQWKGVGLPEGDERRGDTAVPEAKLKDLGHRLTTIPNQVDIHKTLKRVIEARREMIDTGAEHRLGHGREPGLRLAARTRASRSVCRARIRCAAPSASATRASSIRPPRIATSR